MTAICAVSSSINRAIAAGSASMSDVGPYALARRSLSSRSVSDGRERVMRSNDSESEFDAVADPSTIATYT